MIQFTRLWQSVRCVLPLIMLSGCGKTESEKPTQKTDFVLPPQAFLVPVCDVTEQHGESISLRLQLTPSKEVDLRDLVACLRRGDCATVHIQNPEEPVSFTISGISNDAKCDVVCKNRDEVRRIICSLKLLKLFNKFAPDFFDEEQR